MLYFSHSKFDKSLKFRLASVAVVASVASRNNIDRGKWRASGRRWYSLKWYDKLFVFIHVFMSTNNYQLTKRCIEPLSETESLPVNFVFLSVCIVVKLFRYQQYCYEQWCVRESEYGEINFYRMSFDAWSEWWSKWKEIKKV